MARPSPDAWQEPIENFPSPDLLRDQRHDDNFGLGYFSSTPATMESGFTMTQPSSNTPPLVTPQQYVCPSMIATSSIYQTPILPAVPIQGSVSALSAEPNMTPISVKTTKPKHRLTGDERTRLCLMMERYPNKTPDQIGGM